jgi:hypothetical protein
MSDDSERLWNLMIYKMPLTDKEMEEAMPGIAVAALVAIIILAAIVWFSSIGKPEQNPSMTITTDSNVVHLEKEDAP